MNMKILEDVKKYVLTSTITKEDIEVVKKYQPAALKKKDSEGNDIFAISYNEGHSCISAGGVTFGGVNANGNLVITGDLEGRREDYPGFVADKVGAALDHIGDFEASIPAAAQELRTKRDALIASVTIA